MTLIQAASDDEVENQSLPLVELIRVMMWLSPALIGLPYGIGFPPLNNKMSAVHISLR